MKNVANFVLFQLVWFAAVGGAAEGVLWAGPLAAALFLGIHLAMTEPADRLAEFTYVAAVGVAGTLADTALHALGATRYPTSVWSYLLVPPWISSLWIAFAMLPRFSLRWLSGRAWLAVLFGAVGGPLSYLGGTRFGSVGVGDSAWLTYGALAVEYAAVTPLLLGLSPRERSHRADLSRSPAGSSAAQ